MLIQAIKPSKQIVISNTINEARFKMSKAEQKLFLYCVGVVDNSNNMLNTTFEMNVADFADFLELKRKDIHNVMIDTTREMASRVVEFINEDQELIQMPVLSKVHYKKGCVEIKVNSELAPYLIELKNQFTKFSLSEVLSFKSLYSIRIYQILSQWIYKNSVEYTIQELRFILNINEGEYKKYGHFKARVLEIALQEINTNSTLNYGYQELKTGKKVTSIKFIIENNKKKSYSEIKVNKSIIKEDVESANKKPQELSNPAFAPFKALELSHKKITELVEKYSLDYLEYVLKRCGKSLEKKDSKSGYFLTLVDSEDYQDNYQGDMDQIIQENEREKQAQIEREEREKEYEKIRLEKQKKEKELEDKFNLWAENNEMMIDIFTELAISKMGNTKDLKGLKFTTSPKKGNEFILHGKVFNSWLKGVEKV